MKTEKRKLGDKGEEYAVDYLVKNGYKIISRNYLKPFGEIDIIAKENSELVFVEVKTSKFYQNSYFNPEFRVNQKKVNKLNKTAEFYLLKNKFHMKQDWRIDIISIILNADHSLNRLEHLRNI